MFWTNCCNLCHISLRIIIYHTQNFHRLGTCKQTSPVLFKFEFSVMLHKCSTRLEIVSCVKRVKLPLLSESRSRCPFVSCLRVLSSRVSVSVRLYYIVSQVCCSHPNGQTPKLTVYPSQTYLIADLRRPHFKSPTVVDRRDNSRLLRNDIARKGLQPLQHHRYTRRFRTTNHPVAPNQCLATLMPFWNDIFLIPYEICYSSLVPLGADRRTRGERSECSI